MNKNIIASAILAVTALLGSGYAQPNPPTTGNIPCSAEPTGAQNFDTATSAMNAEGFTNLFDSRQMASATNPRGWWQSCLTGHGGPAIFRVDTNKVLYPSVNGSGTGAIYSTQNGTSGGILMTNKKFSFYEFVFDYWPDFGNDGGIFHRTTANGRCFQTVLDYLGGASLGGTWGEGGYVGRDQRPFSFGANESTITISTDPGYGWSNFTARFNPASFGCPTTGCTQVEWRQNWNFNDWNQLRIKFFAGTANTTNVHMYSYFRKIDFNSPRPWVPVSKDTTLNLATPDGYIGLQVHGGGRFGAPRGTWYKRIMWRPTTIIGAPIVNGVALPCVNPAPGGTCSNWEPQVGPVNVRNALGNKVGFAIRATSDALVGSVEVDHQITVRDLKGHTLEIFSGHAGKINYAFKTKTIGLLMVELKTVSGVENIKVNRVIR